MDTGTEAREKSRASVPLKKKRIWKESVRIRKDMTGITPGKTSLLRKPNGTAQVCNSGPSVCRRRITLALSKPRGERPLPATCTMFVHDTHVVVGFEGTGETEVFRPRDCARVDEAFAERCIAFVKTAGYEILRDDMVYEP